MDPPAEATAPAQPSLSAAQPPQPGKKLFSIFSPRPSSSTSTPTLAQAAADPAPAGPGTGRTTVRAASVSALSAAGTETLSLVEDSGESDGGSDAVKRAGGCHRKGKGKVVKKGAHGKGRTVRGEQVGGSDNEVVVVGSSKAGSKKGKGKARDVEATKPSTGKGKKRAPPPSDSDSDDDSYTASSAHSTPRSPTKRRSTRNTAPAQDVIVDLTESPPRKMKKKGKERATEPVGTAGLAFSDERRAARDKAKKREAPEARWPAREEHGGGAGAGETARGAWDARWVRKADVKGKGRALDTDDVTEPSFLDQYTATLDFPAARAALALHSHPSASGSALPTLSRRPLAAVPFLLSPFPSHPLLDRLAAPLRSPASFPSAFARPGDLARAHSEEDAKLWTVKYGPQSADEVLGEVSGQSARWLKEWLEELKVQGAALDAGTTKRKRPVARGVVKKKKKAKKRRALDDFIASSDEDENCANGMPSSSYNSYASDPDEELDNLPAASFSSRAATGSAFPTLTNLILLHGPAGTGKSSTVHAVAQELGFDVFEVFPGMGRRSARDLERYVGDVGRNHVVLGGSPRKGGGNVAAMFKMLQAKTGPGENGKGKEKAAENVGTSEGTSRRAGEKGKGPTQSLILVDEVDVLFKHEEDFWQGLIALAKQSRRPIVMTCTDHSLVPVNDLGLQQIVHNPSSPPVNFLSFAAPSPDIAVPYLQLVALREGHILPASTVATLYTSFSRSRPYPPWLTQQQPGERPLPHPLTSMPLPSDDLRKALMQLQVECGWGVGGRTSVGGWAVEDGDSETRWSEETLRMPLDVEVADAPESIAMSLVEAGKAAGGPVESLECAALAADALSFADAHVARRIAVLIGNEETGRFTTSGDAEETFPVLEYEVREETQRLPYIGAEPAMAHAIDSLAHGLWDAALRFGEREDEELESKRSDFAFHLGQLVHSGGEHALLQPPDPILPASAVTTEYRPYLRAITLADDMHHAASALATAAAAEDGGAGEVHALGMAAALAAGPGGARKTRKSARQKAQQGKPMYERVLDWASEAEAEWLRQSGFDG